MAAHSCETCGLLHDAPAPPAESEAVTLARIAKEQAVEVARINARTERDWNETRVEVAEVEAGAEVAAAEATAEVVAAVIGSSDEPDPEPDPIVIDAPAIEDQADDAEELPPTEGSPVPTAKRKSAGIGFW